MMPTWCWLVLIALLLWVIVRGWLDADRLVGELYRRDWPERDAR